MNPYQQYYIFIKFDPVPEAKIAKLHFFELSKKFNELNSKNVSLFQKNRKTKELRKPVFDDLIRNGNNICNSSVIVKKDLLEKIGYISENPELVTCEDYETWIRLSKITDNFKRIPKTLGYYWNNTENLSSHTQTIKNIQTIKYHLIKSYSINSDISLWWMDYFTGRSYYHMKNYVLAQKFIKKVSGTTFVNRLKCYYMLVICFIKLR